MLLCLFSSYSSAHHPSSARSDPYPSSMYLHCKLFPASSPWNNCHTLCTARFFFLLSPLSISGGSISTAAAEEAATNNKTAANNGSLLSVWLACLAWPNTVILASAVPPLPPHNHRPPASSSSTWEGKH